MGSIQQTPILSAPVQAVLRAQGISPSDFVYVNLSDTLVILEWSSVAGQNLRVVFRVMDKSGNIHLQEHDLTTSGSRISQLRVRSLGEGILLSVNGFILPEGTRRGQVFLSVQFQFGGFPQNIRTQTLCSGYITSTDNVSFPRGSIDKAFDGRGNIRSITGTTPGAGTDISETVPTGAVWQLRSFKYDITTSAVVGNRASLLIIDDGTTTLQEYVPASTTPASSAASYFWTPGKGNTGGLGINSNGFSDGITLLAGWRIRTFTTSLDAGDQYTSPKYSVEEWLQQ